MVVPDIEAERLYCGEVMRGAVCLFLDVLALSFLNDRVLSNWIPAPLTKLHNVVDEKVRHPSSSITEHQ